MKWLKNILMAIALMNLALAPAAIAAPTMATAALEAADPKLAAQLAAFNKMMGERGLVTSLDATQKNILVHDQNGALVMTVPFSNETALRKFSPKSVGQLLSNEMARVNSSNKAAWSHSLRALPTESAIFFMAMGAVVAGQMITNYAQNPVGMHKHLEHSMSPLGTFGFFTFMYSQGVTSNMLSMYMKNPKYHVMIPYLGMTVGAFVQTYLSQVLSDPNVGACAAVMMGKPVTEEQLSLGIDPDPCSKAYEYLVVQKKIWEFAPGIASMLISSAVAGVGQSALTKAVLKLTGVDMAMWLMPGAMQLKGIRLLLVKGLQITAFVAIDAWMNRAVTFAWKNAFDGADFYDQNDRLNQQVNALKKGAWDPQEKKVLPWSGDDKALQTEIKDFRNKMSGWRMMNMSEVYEAHQAWQESLHQLTSMYNTSYAFYGNITNEIRSSRFQLSATQPLLMNSPLAGVVSRDLTEGSEDIYLLKPQFALGGQMSTVKEASLTIKRFLALRTSPEIYPRETTQLNEIAALLGSENEQKMGEGIAALQKIKSDNEAGLQSSPQFYELIVKVIASLGEATPSAGVGQGYMAAYEKAPSTAESIRGTNYYRVAGSFQTPKITDYLTVQMLCGPDVEAGQSAIRNSMGFPSVFLPPSIIRPVDNLAACRPEGTNSLSSDHIYNFRIQSPTGQAYNGAISYLLAEARPSVIGTKDQGNFEAWWKEKTEAQMVKAFDEYAKAYDEIVVKMVKAIYHPGRNWFNGRKPFINPASEQSRKRLFEGGPVFNGAMNSMFQEERVYLSLLEEIMKPSARFNVDIATIMDKAPTNATLKAVEYEFSIMNALIRKIKIQKIDETPRATRAGQIMTGGREVIISDLENYQLEEQLQHIQEAITKVSTILGVGDATEGAEFKLNLKQRDLAVTALEQLQGLATEMMMYGTMANAVSWNKIRDLKRLNMEQEQFNNDVQRQFNEMSRGMRLGAK